MTVMEKTPFFLWALAWAAAPLYGQGGKDSVEIRISFGNEVLTASLNNSPAARDLAAMLPLTLEFGDYQGMEKFGRLPRKLNLEGTPRGYDPAKGDLAQYTPWGNLIIYYKEASYYPGLIPLGKITSGMDAVTRMKEGEKVRIELSQ